MKYDCYKLAQRVADGGEQDLKPEEVVLLKKRISDSFGPIIVGRAYDILNG